MAAVTIEERLGALVWPVEADVTKSCARLDLVTRKTLPKILGESEYRLSIKAA
jgi:hypothetical protein